jgi:iron-sulfur cluster assembly protein/iron-sulfur cluster insertion protein
MSMFTVTDASQVIRITDDDAKNVSEFIAAEDSADELVVPGAVRPGGGSWFSYEMFFDTDVAADDAQTEHEGVKVVVDPASQQMLKGATLNYKDGLQGAGFAINNPNAERSCGCGQSFS